MYNNLSNRPDNGNNCAKGCLCFFMVTSMIACFFFFIRSQQLPDQIINIQGSYSCYLFCDGYTYNYNSYCCQQYNGYNCVDSQICKQNKINQLNNDIHTYQNLAVFFVAFSFSLSICLCCMKKSRNAARNPQVPDIYANQAYNQINISQQSAQSRQPAGAKKRRIEENYESFAVESEETCCAVCMMEFAGEKAIILKCGHIFHSKCIRDWAVKQENCPVCRASH